MGQKPDAVAGGALTIEFAATACAADATMRGMLLMLLSPAKTLDFATPALSALPHGTPAFAREAAQLIDVLRERSPAQLAELMDLSEPLAALNSARHQSWSTRSGTRNAKQALLAFDGAVEEAKRIVALGGPGA